jgi:hypothetical protein
MLIVGIAFVVVTLLGAGVLWHAIKRAPLAYEDAKGFHTVPEETDVGEGTATNSTGKPPGGNESLAA